MSMPKRFLSLAALSAVGFPVGLLASAVHRKEIQAAALAARASGGFPHRDGHGKGISAALAHQAHQRSVVPGPGSGRRARPSGGGIQHQIRRHPHRGALTRPASLLPLDLQQLNRKDQRSVAANPGRLAPGAVGQFRRDENQPFSPGRMSCSTWSHPSITKWRFTRNLKGRAGSCIWSKTVPSSKLPM